MSRGTTAAEWVEGRVAIDARREEIYLQAFDGDGAALGPAEIVPVDAALSLVARDALPVYGSAAGLLGHPDGEAPAYPSILSVAEIGAAADPRQAPAAPLYLRGPDANPQAGFTVARA